MRKALRWTGIALLVILLIAAAGVFFFTKSLAEFAGTQALGRQVNIAGDLDIDLSSTPTIHANKVTIDNPEWAKAPHLLEAGSLTASVNARQLLSGEQVFPVLSIKDSILSLEKSEDGRVNWDFGGKEEKTKQLPEVKNLQVENSQVVYRDHGAKMEISATIDKLRGSATSDQPVQLAGSGRIEDKPFTVDLTAGSMSQLESENTPYPVKLDLAVGSAKAQINGTISQPLQLQGMDLKVAVAGEDLGGLLPTDAYPTLNGKAFNVDGRLLKSDQLWQLTGFQADLAQSGLRGTASVNMSGAKPFVQADLKSSGVNADLIKGLINQPGKKDDKEAASSGSSFNLQQLGKVNADVNLHIEDVIGTSLPLHDIVVDLALKDGILKVEPLKVGVADGQLTATTTLDTSLPEIEGKIAMEFSSVPVAPLLDPFIEHEIDGGILGGNFIVAFAGSSIGTADGKIRYRNPSEETNLVFDVSRVKPEQEWMLNVHGDGTFRGAPANADFVGQPFALLDNPNATIPVEVDVSLAKTDAKATGTITGLADAVDLRVALSGPGTQRLSRLLEFDLPKLPRYSASGHVTKKQDTVAVENLTAKLGSSDLKGSALVRNYKDKPFIKADLKSTTLAYEDVKPLRTESDEPFDWDQLKKVNADINYTASRILAPENLVFKNIRLEADLVDGRLSVHPLRFGIADGKVALNASISADPKKALRGNIDADVDHVNLGKALKPFGLGERFSGILDADIDMPLGRTALGKTRDSTIRYNEAGPGNDITFVIAQTPEKTLVQGGGFFNKEPFALQGTLGPLSQLSAPGKFPLDIRLKVLDTLGHIVGTLREPLSLNGLDSTLVVSGPTPQRAGPFVGFRLPDLPPYRLQGNLTRQEGIWQFKDFEGKVGDSDLSGRIVVDNKEGKPAIFSRLYSYELNFGDLAGLIGAAEGDEKTGAASEGASAEKQDDRGLLLPDEPFRFDLLTNFNADVEYRAETVRSERYPLDNLLIDFMLQDGRVTLEPVRFGVAGGRVVTNIMLAAGESPAKATIDVQADTVNLGRIVKKIELPEDKVGTGTIGGKAEFQATGNSLAKMLASLNGDASLVMAGGQLDSLLVELGGLDAGEAILQWIGKSRMIPVRCAYVDINARSGVLSMQQAVVDTTDTKFVLDGKVNLATETLDLALMARPKDFSIFAARAPLILEGTFRDINAHPSWGSLLTRGAVGVALGTIIAPPAAILAFIEPGLGQSDSCEVGVR
jgi:uncharacterized protein involved in outer membrane biogenesis